MGWLVPSAECIASASFLLTVEQVRKILPTCHFPALVGAGLVTLEVRGS